MDSNFEHFLVPKAVKLSEEDVSSLLKKLNCTLKQLPRVKSDDASLTGLDAQEGEVIKYSRKSATTHKDESYYRVVLA